MKKSLILMILFINQVISQEYRDETVNFDGTKLISELGYDEMKYTIPSISFSFMDRNNPSSKIFRKSLIEYRKVNFPSGYIDLGYHPILDLNSSTFDLSINEDFYPFIDKNLTRINGITWNEFKEQVGDNKELIELNLKHQRLAYVNDRFYRNASKKIIKSIFSDENGDWTLNKLFQLYSNSRSYEETLDASLKVGDTKEVLSRNSESILEEIYFMTFELFVVGDNSNEYLPKEFNVNTSSGSMQDWANNYPLWSLKSLSGLTVGGIAYVSKILWDDKTTEDFFENWYKNPDFFKKNKGYEVWTFSKRIISSSTVSLSNFDSREDAISQATFNLLDKFINKIQDKNPRFRPITKLINNDPNQVKVGTKEGITSRSKFTVYELISKNNIDRLRRIGKLKVSELWKNEFNINSTLNNGTTILKGKKFPIGSFLKLK